MAAVRRQRPRESAALIAFGRQMRRLREAKGIKQETIAHLKLWQRSGGRFEYE
jgi:hypothetical protein